MNSIKFDPIPINLTAEMMAHNSNDDGLAINKLILQKLEDKKYPILIDLPYLPRNIILGFIKRLIDAGYQTLCDGQTLEITNPFDRTKMPSKNVYRHTSEAFPYDIINRKLDFYDVVEIIVPRVWVNARKQDLLLMGCKVTMARHDEIDELFSITKHIKQPTNICMIPSENNLHGPS